MTEPTEYRKISTGVKAAWIGLAGAILAAIVGPVITYRMSAFPPYNENLNRFDYSTFEKKLVQCPL